MAERPYHHGNLRVALLASAEEVLREQGDLSLRELARRVGVSHAAPRRHFADRQALLDALAVDGFERLGTTLRTAIDGAGDAFDDRLTAAARAYVGFATEHAELLEIMFAGKHRPGAEQIIETADAAFANLIDLVHEGREGGHLDPQGPIETIGLLAFSTLHGLAAITNQGMFDAAALDAIVPEVVGRLLSGLRPRSGRAARPARRA